MKVIGCDRCFVGSVRIMHVARAALVDGAECVGEERNDTLEEEVEEKDSTGTTEESVEDESNLAQVGAQCRHPKPCNK